MRAHSSIVILSEAKNLSRSHHMSLMHSSIVILSEAKDLAHRAMMLRSTQHDRGAALCFCGTSAYCELKQADLMLVPLST